VPLWIALVLVAVLLGVLFVAFARDPGPDPADVAIAFERAFDLLDFSLLLRPLGRRAARRPAP
jgi:hypothetical protein